MVLIFLLLLLLIFFLILFFILLFLSFPPQKLYPPRPLRAVLT
jgi:hypothetical protein